MLHAPERFDTCVLNQPFPRRRAVAAEIDGGHDMANQLRIAFIGAGGVNFGGAEGPWDHASRLEKIGDVSVAGVADPDTARATRVLQARQS